VDILLNPLGQLKYTDAMAHIVNQDVALIVEHYVWEEGSSRAVIGWCSAGISLKPITRLLVSHHLGSCMEVLFHVKLKVWAQTIF